MKTNEIIDIETTFYENCRKAEKLVNHPDKVDRMLKRLERKLQNLPKLGGALAYIPKMGMMVNSFIRGDYKDVPIGTFVAIIGVLTYFISPVDAIPDYIPGIGLVDDAAVVSGSLYLVKSDLDEYMHWRQMVGLD